MEDHYKHPVDVKKVKFRLNLIGSKNFNWVIIITILSFFISASLSFASSEILEGMRVFPAFCVVLFIILVNILFDIVGIAVTAADEIPFHAMASRKFFGAREAIILIRNANKVSSFCNDVVGDICGVISGAASALILLKLSQVITTNLQLILSLVVTGMVAALTIGGKALGKTFAIENSNYIVYKAGVVLTLFTVRIGIKKKRNKKSTKITKITKKDEIKK